MTNRTSTKLVALLLLMLAGPAQAYICGDVDGSKKVSAPDALAALKLSVGQDLEVDCGSQHRTLVTGLTQCSDTDGNFIDCPGTGQDGELQKGAPRAFVDNGNGTVTDRGTGLVWELFDAAGGLHDQDRKSNWEGAYDKIAQLNAASFAGHSDWRLPNVFEVTSLGSFGQPNSGLPLPYFQHDCTPGCALPACACLALPSYEWSSTTWPSSPGAAFALRTVIGDPIIQAKSLENYTTRAVRGGYSTSDISNNQAFTLSCADVNASDSITAPDALAILRKSVGQEVDLTCVLRSTTLATGQTDCFNSDGMVVACAGTGQDGELQRGLARTFTNNGNGTATDNQTGLVWELLSGDDSVHSGVSVYPWAEAQTKIDELNETNFAGHSDWRVPNFFELDSVVNFGSADTALYKVFDDGCLKGCSNTQCSCAPAINSVWSSTTPLNNKVYALKTHFGTGRTDWELKTIGLHVRGVRGGD